MKTVTASANRELDEILDLMAELKRETGAAMVLITHDMGVIARLADRVCVMKDGAYVEAGEAEALFAHPQTDYAKSLHTLAALHQDMGDYRKALPLFEQGLELLESALGKKHPDCAAALNNLVNSLLQFLRREAEYHDAPAPDVILLDLNLPRKDGRQVLSEMKQDPELRLIPVVVLTTSEAERDILKSYELHANCYITKPVDLDKFIYIVRTIEAFWLAVVTLPNRRADSLSGATAAA